MGRVRNRVVRKLRNESTTRGTVLNSACRLPWSVLGVLVLVACEKSGPPNQAPPVEQEASALGINLPYLVEPACPGEGCSYGSWLACDSIPLYLTAGATTPTGEFLSPEQQFEVTSGAVVIEDPTVVVVTRPTRQAPFSDDARTFNPGDTLYVLDYLGEGFFNAHYSDSTIEVGVFWPWDNFFVRDDFEYGGEVVRAGRSSFWVRTVGVRGSEAWVWVDSASVAAPNALEPDPPVCR